MPRLQDILFVAFAVALASLIAFGLRIAVFALVGAFLCGSAYLFTGMIPPRTEAFWRRVFTTVFLAAVMSCLVLIVPGTFSANRADLAGTVLIVAALLPVVAFCFEVVRTPGVAAAILRSLGWR